MLSIPPTTKLWYGGAVDLRLGFDGLYRHVQSTLQADPLSGHLFIFTNAAANRLKVLLLEPPRTLSVVPATGERPVPLPHARGEHARTHRDRVRHDPRRHRLPLGPALQAVFSPES